MVSIKEKEDEEIEEEEYRDDRFYSSVMEKPAKIVLIGDSGVGKSSLLYRIQRDIFHEQGQHTVGKLTLEHTCLTERNSNRKNFLLF